MEPKYGFKLFGAQISLPLEDFKLIGFQETETSQPRKRTRPVLHYFGDLVKPEIKKPPPKTKRAKIKRSKLPTPPKAQELPPRYRRFVLERGADEKSLTLVLIKRLKITDTNPQQKRLSFPCKKILERFLDPEEEEFLKGSEKIGDRVCKNKLDVMVVDPLCETMRRLKLAKWNDAEPEPDQAGQRKKSWLLALISNWPDLVRENGLKPDEVVQVWSFRIQGELGFIIHKIESGSSSGSGSTVEDNAPRSL